MKKPNNSNVMQYQTVTTAQPSRMAITPPNHPSLRSATFVLADSEKSWWADS